MLCVMFWRDALIFWNDVLIFLNNCLNAVLAGCFDGKALVKLLNRHPQLHEII